MKHKIKSILFKTLFSICLIVSILITSVIAATAMNTGLYTNNKLFSAGDLWDGLSTDIADVGSRDSFPIKNSDTDPNNVTKLSLDILLGIDRDVVSYTGVYPLRYVKTKDNINVIQIPAGLEDVPYMMVDAGGDANGIKLNWAAGAITWVENQDPVQTVLNYANGNGVARDLRVYALTQHKGEWINFGNILYTITKWFAKVATSIMNLIISVKNINVSSLLEMLGLEKLLEVFNTVFLGDGFNGASIFIILAICSLIITIVAYVKWYTTGKGKVTRKSEIFIPLICGVLVICMALTGNLTSIGTNLANAVDKIAMDMFVESNPESTSNLFVIKSNNINKTIGGESFNIPDSRIVSLQEQALLNKVLIDTQICTQFGVNKIEDLNFSQSYSAWLNTSNSNLSSAFHALNDNLGYYYWFANSVMPTGVLNSVTNSANAPSAISTLRSDNFEYDTANVDKKMEGIINFLQAVYAGGNGATKNKVLKIMTNFAEPKMGGGALTFFLLTIELILLIFVTIRLVLKILISKLICAGSVLALPIAGPLILSSRKKLMDTGKMLCFVFLVYSIKVFVLSVLFDLILYLVVILFDTDIISILITIGLTAGLSAFLPQVMGWLSNALNNITNAISPELTSKTNAIKQRTRGLIGRAATAYDSSTKTKTIYDADGNAHKITVKRKGNLLSKAMHLTENNLSDVRNTHTTFGLMHGLNKDKALAESEALNREAENNVKKIESAIDTDINNKKKELYVPNSDGSITENINNINVSALMNNEQKDLYKQAIDAAALRDAIKNEIDPALLEKYNNGEKLTKEEREKIEKYQSSLRAATTAANEAEGRFKNKLSDDTRKYAVSRHKKELENALIDQRDLGKRYKDKSTLSSDQKDKFKVSESLAQKKLNALETGAFTTSIALDAAEKDAVINGKRIRSNQEIQYHNTDKLKKDKYKEIVDAAHATDERKLSDAKKQKQLNETNQVNDTNESSQENKDFDEDKPINKPINSSNQKITEAKKISSESKLTNDSQKPTDANKQNNTKESTIKDKEQLFREPIKTNDVSKSDSKQSTSDNTESSSKPESPEPNKQATKPLADKTGSEQVGQKITASSDKSTNKQVFNEPGTVKQTSSDKLESTPVSTLHINAKNKGVQDTKEQQPQTDIKQQAAKQPETAKPETQTPSNTRPVLNNPFEGTTEQKTAGFEQVDGASTTKRAATNVKNEQFSSQKLKQEATQVPDQQPVERQTETTPKVDTNVYKQETIKPQVEKQTNTTERQSSNTVNTQYANTRQEQNQSNNQASYESIDGATTSKRAAANVRNTQFNQQTTFNQSEQQPVEKPAESTKTTRNVVEQSEATKQTEKIKTVEKVVEKPVEKVTERKVEKVVEKPVERTRTVEKVVEKPTTSETRTSNVVNNPFEGTVERKSTGFEQVDGASTSKRAATNARNEQFNQQAQHAPKREPEQPKQTQSQAESNTTKSKSQTEKVVSQPTQEQKTTQQPDLRSIPVESKQQPVINTKPPEVRQTKKVERPQLYNEQAFINRDKNKFMNREIRKEYAQEKVDQAKSATKFKINKKEEE